jgi:hypothetical protein
MNAIDRERPFWPMTVRARRDQLPALLQQLMHNGHPPPTRPQVGYSRFTSRSALRLAGPALCNQLIEEFTDTVRAHVRRTLLSWTPVIRR